jgi:hypothetical protein
LRFANSDELAKFVKTHLRKVRHYGPEAIDSNLARIDPTAQSLRNRAPMLLVQYARYS